MSQFKIKAALADAIIKLNLGIPLSFPNVKFTAPDNGAYGEVSFVFNPPVVSTLGDDGEDYHDGFVQVLLKFPRGDGDTPLMKMADTIRESFPAGTRVSYSGQEVVILSCGIGGFSESDSRFVCPVTINWYAKTRR